VGAAWTRFSVIMLAICAVIMPGIDELKKLTARTIERYRKALTYRNEVIALQERLQGASQCRNEKVYCPLYM
jgi:hypothetical protein